MRLLELNQFAITFCDGDLDPDTKRAAYRDRGLKPPKSVNDRILKTTFT